MRPAGILCTLLPFFLLEITLAGDSAPEDKQYSLVSQVFGNVDWTTAPKNLWKASLWGAFTYECAGAVLEGARQCTNCNVKRLQPNVDCSAMLNHGAKALALGVFMVGGGYNAFEKRDMSDGTPMVVWEMAKYYDNVDDDNLTVSHHYYDDDNNNLHIVINHTEYNYFFDLSYQYDSSNRGTVSVVPMIQPDNNGTLVKREAIYGLCGAQLNVDYCHNGNYKAGMCASGWSDMAQFIADHFSAVGKIDPYTGDEEDWSSDFWKMYAHTDDSDYDWITSFRYYYSNDGAFIHYTHCDNGH